MKQCKLPPLTVTWAQCEAAWDALGPSFSPGDLLACEAGKLEEQFFRERLVYDPNLDVLHVRFDYDYEVDTEEITRPLHLLRWTAHLAGKTWMNATFIHEFIEKVCAVKGWDLHRG